MNKLLMTFTLLLTLLSTSAQARIAPPPDPVTMGGTWYCQGQRGKPMIELTLREQVEYGGELEASWQRGEAWAPLDLSMSDQALSGVLLARPFGSLALRRDDLTGHLDGWWQRAGQIEELHCAREWPIDMV
jgi:hypothetical protein